MNGVKLFPYFMKIVSSARRSISLSQGLGRIEHEVAKQRFTMRLPTDDAYVGYKPVENVLNLNMIFVPRRYRALGIGQDLAWEVLDYCAGKEIMVVLSCPYLVTFFQQHPYPQFKKVVRGLAAPKRATKS